MRCLWDFNESQRLFRSITIAFKRLNVYKGISRYLYRRRNFLHPLRFFEPRNTLDSGGNLFLSMMGNCDVLPGHLILYILLNLFFTLLHSSNLLLQSMLCHQSYILTSLLNPTQKYYRFHKTIYNLNLVNQFQCEYVYFAHVRCALFCHRWEEIQ